MYVVSVCNNRATVRINGDILGEVTYRRENCYRLWFNKEDNPQLIASRMFEGSAKYIDTILEDPHKYIYKYRRAP